MTNTQPSIPRRGHISPKFRKKIDGEYKRLIQFIVADPELDIQLRDDYFNVYYNGGCVLKLSSSKLSSMGNFDKFYFFPEVIKKYNSPGIEIRKTYVEEVYKGKENKRGFLPVGYPDKETADAVIKELENRRDHLLKKLSDGDYEGYFSEAKEVVGNFVEINKRKERKDQHNISISNRSITENNDLVVIDLEFAVSTRKPYNKAKNTKGNQKVPKIDIIAVDVQGQLYAIELKSNIGADAEDSPQNIKAHRKDFDDSIGSSAVENDFPKEMEVVVEEKKRLGILSASIKVSEATPIFTIAFAGEEKEKQEFLKRYSNSGIPIVNVGKEHRYLTIHK